VLLNNKSDNKTMILNCLTQPKIFSNVIKLLQITHCIAPTSVSCERLFSRMNLVKDKTRNRIGSALLGDLLMVVASGPEPRDF